MKKFALLFVLFHAAVILLSPATSALSGGVDFLQVFDGHGSVMLLIDSQTGAIQYANEAASTFYGYTKEQLESMKISQINTLSPEDTAREMQAAVEEERNYFIFKHRLANGDIRTVEVYSYPYREGSRDMLFSVIHDITDKTLLAEKNKTLSRTFFVLSACVMLFLLALICLLYQNYQKLKARKGEIENFNELRKTFIDADDSLIYLKDENLKYVFVNRAFEEFFHKDSAEIIGCDDFDLSEREFAEKRRKSDMNVAERKKVVIDEVRWENRRYKTTKFPVRMLNGKFGVGAYIKDVTDEFEYKREQEKSLQRNQILVDVLNLDFQTAQEQLDYFLHEALKLTESRFGYIYLYSEESREFILNSWSKDVMAACMVVEKQTKYQLEKTGIWGEVVRQRKPIVVNDFETPNPLKKGCPKGHVGITKFMSVPVIIDGKIVAAVGLANKENDYSENDVYQISVLMNGAWNAMERREAQVRLAVERKRYLMTLLSIGDGVMVVDREGGIEMLNRVAERLTGWTIEEARGKAYKEVFVLSHEQEGFFIEDPVEKVFMTGMVQELDNHAVLTSKNNTRYQLEDSAAPIRDQEGRIHGVVLVFRDVTEKKEQRKEIEYLSFHDFLTGLFNRRFFEEKMKGLDTEENLPISIIMGDLNGLKLTNDIFGHTYGDILLKEMARIFREEGRDFDVAARWGGDEFIMLLPKTGADTAERIASDMKERFSRVQVKSVRGSVSIGCDTKNQGGESILRALENAENRMYAEKTLERGSIHKSLIGSILKTLHESYPNEGRHAVKVSELCRDIGKAMHLPEEEIRRLKEAAFLHDIGKITIEPGLLDKKSSLTQKEWEIIRQHPAVGCRLLNFFDETLDLAESVLNHHERWDGSGYPKGLKGEEIPLLARIIALAESFDKMAGGTLYRPSLSREEALAEIERNAGTQFDPVLARLFVKTLSAAAHE